MVEFMLKDSASVFYLSCFLPVSDCDQCLKNCLINEGTHVLK